MSLAPGIKLGSYEIVAPLGAGGMGEVYRARDTLLKREVAVKILPDSYSSDPERLRRFQQEGEAAAALNHPNILTVHHVGQQDGISYIVTELLQGDTLREKLRGGPLPVRTAIDYAVQIARGLDTAHEKGIVHRDLKPENLFVTREGRIKILDFGLAKLTEHQPYSVASLRTVTEETIPGAVMGTLGYMSPEQVRGQAANPRSDIFAFGAVLFEMLTGNRAFRGTTSADTMSAILNQDPPISQLAANHLPGLQRVITRCLQKNPEERFHSAADLAFAIEALTDVPSATQPAAPVRDSQALRWAKWMVAPALVLAAVSIGFYLHRSSSATGSRASPASLEVRALTESGKAIRAAATPDGRYIAYVNNDAGNFELRLLQVATERDVQILSGVHQRIRSLHFSPDGNFIYFLRQLDPGDSDALGVFRIATLGGPATPLATDARMYSLTVSPDGKQIAYIAETQSESQIVAIDPEGTNRHILAKRSLASGFWFIEWSPFLNMLAAVAIGHDDMGLVSIELPAGSIRDLSVSGWGAVGQPAWSPDGATIFAPALPASSNPPSIMQIWAVDARTGAHRPLTSGSTEYLEWTLSATAAGDLIANTSTPAITIWATDQSAQPHLITAVRGEGSESVIWVDGRIVTSNIPEMMVHDLDGGNSTKLRSHSSIYRQLARCGPGQVAYWAHDGEHQSHIARTDIVTGSTSRLTDGPLDDEPTCTADGSTLIFTHCIDQGNRCFLTRRSINSGQSLALYQFALQGGMTSPNPTLSPDGTNVFFRQFRQELDARNPYEWAMVVPTVGGSPQKLKMPVPSGEVTAFTWAPDGKSILYARNEHGVGNIWSAPLDGKAPRKLTAFDSEEIFAFGVSPDNRFVISRGSIVRDVVLIKNAR
jgi:Tol biopolymer transport system component